MLVLAGTADPAAINTRVDLDLDRTTVVGERELNVGWAESRFWDLVVLGGSSLGCLRALSPRLDQLGTTRDVRVVVLATDRPWLLPTPGWEMRPLVTATTSPQPQMIGTLALGLLAGAVDPLAIHARPSRAQRDARAKARSVRWLELARASRNAVEGQRMALSAARPHPTDTGAVSPVGFDPLDQEDAQASAVVLRRTRRRGGGLVGSANGSQVVDLKAHAAFDERDVAALRPYRHVEIDATAVDGPLQLGELLSQLLVAGVPVRIPALPLPVASWLGPRLTALLAAASPQGFRDAWAREEWSVAARREALTRFGLGLPGYAGTASPAVSVVANAATAEEVARILKQLARQDVATELVVKYGGRPDEVASFAPPRIPLTVVPRVDDGPASLRALAGSCSHDLVAVVDPAQHYGRHHLHDLLVARAYAGVESVASAGSLVYLEALDVTVRVPASAPERLAFAAAGGTLLTSRQRLSMVGDGSESAAVAALVATTGLYVTHGLGVLRRTGARADDLREVLGASTHQRSGLVVPDDLRGADVGPPAARVPAYRSYFAA